MSDFKIACEAKALAVFIPSPPPVIKYKPYFHVDFSKKHILSLIQDFPIRGIRSAGICLINMPFSSHEQTLMAFRVQWKEGDLVRNADPNIDAIVPVDFPIPEQGIVPFITVTSVEGDAVWVQAKDGDFLTVPRFGFVFFDTETLKKLVEIPGCTHLRFRRTIIRSKLKLPPNPASESAKGFFLTLTVEPVPTWEDKVY